MAESSHDAALFVDAHRVELIGRVRKVWPIASALLLKGVARNRWLLLMNSSCQEQMRELYRDLDAGGEAVKATFYTLLKEHEPRLLQELESRGEQREDELRKDRGRKQEEKREAETAAEREEKAKRREEEAKRREEEVEKQRAEMERRRESLEREREEILREREELEKMREETQRQREELERRMEEEKQKKREKCKLPLKKVYSLDILPPNIGEEPLQVAPPPPHEPELRLLLLGRSGAGKSTVGNAMLPGDGPAPPTLISQRRRGSIAGRQVCVVDTPDWFRPGLSPEEMRRDVGVSIKLCAPGPHAFLLLLPLHQPEQEGRDTVQKMVEIFGEGCLGHTLILLTHRNELRDGTVREHVQNQDLRGVLEKCGNRHQLFRMDRPDITQVTDLLEKIKEMVAGNTEEFYSSEMYQEVELQVKELEEKIKREREERKEREEREEREMKERYERELQESLRKMEGVIQEREEKIRTLEERIEELETELREEGNEERRTELERELRREKEQRKETEREIEELREEKEKEKKERDEMHKQEVQELRQSYEENARAEAERQLMKIVLPEVFSRLHSLSRSKIHGECNRQIQEQSEEIERIKEEKEREIMRIKEEMKGAIERVKNEKERAMERLKVLEDREVARGCGLRESPSAGGWGGQLPWLLRGLMVASCTSLFLFWLNWAGGYFHSALALLCCAALLAVVAVLAAVDWGLRTVLTRLTPERITQRNGPD